LSLDFGRIEHLISPEALRNRLITQIGVGSGGAPVCDHLTMNGVMRWVLYDPDRLGPENLVKHPHPRSRLGDLKVDVQRDWILDRNPEAQVRAIGEDVFESPQFQRDVNSDLILCCADSRSVRLFVNDIAVAARRPCVTASVYRQGFGGRGLRIFARSHRLLRMHGASC